MDKEMNEEFVKKIDKVKGFSNMVTDMLGEKVEQKKRKLMNKEISEKIKFVEVALNKWQDGYLLKKYKEISKEYKEEFFEVTKILSDFFPKLEDLTVFEIDDILYPGQEYKGNENSKYDYDPKKMFEIPNFSTYFRAYSDVMDLENNAYLDNTVLKIVKYVPYYISPLHSTMNYLLNSGNERYVCIGLKMWKVILEKNEVVKQIVLYSSLSRLRDVTEAKDPRKKIMSNFISKLAGDCCNLMGNEYVRPKAGSDKEKIIEGIHCLISNASIPNCYTDNIYQTFSKTFSSDTEDTEDNLKIRRKYLKSILIGLISCPMRLSVYKVIPILIKCLLDKNGEVQSHIVTKEMKLLDAEYGRNIKPYLKEINFFVNSKEIWNDDDDDDEEEEEDDDDKDDDDVEDTETTDYTFEKFFYYDEVMKNLHLLAIFYTALAECQNLCKGEFFDDYTDEFCKDNYLVKRIARYLKNPDVVVPWHVEKTMEMCPFLLFPLEHKDLVVDLIKYLREYDRKMSEEFAKKIEKVEGFSNVVIVTLREKVEQKKRETMSKEISEKMKFVEVALKKWQDGYLLKKYQEIPEEYKEEFFKVTKILSDIFPKVEDPSVFEIDDILYPGQEYKGNENSKYDYDPKKVFEIPNISTYFRAYSDLIDEKQIFLDNTVLRFLKHITHNLDTLYNVLKTLLYSGNARKVCIGLRMYKIVLESKSSEFKDVYPMLLRLKDITEAKEQNKKRMSNFISKLAGECCNLMEDLFFFPEIGLSNKEIIIRCLHFILYKDNFTDYYVNLFYKTIMSTTEEAEKHKYLRYILCVINSYGYRTTMKSAFSTIIDSLLHNIVSCKYDSINNDLKVIDKKYRCNFKYLRSVPVSIDSKKVWSDEVNVKDETDYTFEKFFFYDEVMKNLHLLTIFYTACAECNTLCEDEFDEEDYTGIFREKNCLMEYIAFFLNNPKLVVPWHIEKTILMCPFLLFPIKYKDFVVDLIKYLRGEEVPNMSRQLHKKIQEMKAFRSELNLKRQKDLSRFEKR